MHTSDPRFFIYNLLSNYKSYDSEEETSRKEMLDFVINNEMCFDNKFKAGHITGSALVINKSFKSTLLNHHLKLDKWFQFGGHSDGDANPLAVGLREAYEESGLSSLEFLPQYSGIFDVDIHPIPERNEMPLHNHFDIRILLVADDSEKIIVSSESKDLRWVTLDEAKALNSQSAFHRLIEKAKQIKQ